MSGLTVEYAGFKRASPQPNLEVAAVLSDVNGHVSEARTAVVIAGRPADIIVARTCDLLRRERRGRSLAIDGLAYRCRVLWRHRVEQDPGARGELRARRQILTRQHRIADGPFRVAR